MSLYEVLKMTHDIFMLDFAECDIRFSFWDSSSKFADVEFFKIEAGDGIFKLPEKILHNGEIYKIGGFAQKSSYIINGGNLFVPSCYKNIPKNSNFFNLDSITIPDDHPTFYSTNEMIIAKETNVLHFVCPNPEIIIPKGIKKYKKECFCNSKIKIIRFEDGFSFDDFCFGNLQNNFVFPGKYQQIDGIIYFNDALIYCPRNKVKGKKIILNENISKITKGTFSNCEIGLLDLSNTKIKKIDLKTFKFSKFEKIIFPNGLEVIGEKAFYKCDIKDVDLSKTKLASIERESFAFSTIESIMFPRSLSSIGSSAFKGCKNLKCLDFSKFDITFSDSVFKDSGIENMIFPNNMISLNSSIIDNCQNLKRLDLSNTVIEEMQYGYCLLMEEVVFPKSLDVLNQSFEKLKVFDISNTKVKSYSHGLYDHEKFILPKCIKFLSVYVISDNNVKELIFHPNTELRSLVFENKKIDQIKWPKKYKDIDGIIYFENKLIFCPTNIQGNVKIVEGTRKISGGAFCNNKLDSIQFPQSLESIGKYSFKNCDIANLDFRNTKLRRIGEGAFKNSKISKFMFPNSLVRIKQHVFAKTKNLNELDLSNTGVEFIDFDTFGESNVKTIQFPFCLSSIYFQAFQQSNLQKVNLPKNVHFYKGAFEKCENLKLVEISDANEEAKNIFAENFPNVKVEITRSQAEPIIDESRSIYIINEGDFEYNEEKNDVIFINLSFFNKIITHNKGTIYCFKNAEIETDLSSNHVYHNLWLEKEDEEYDENCCITLSSQYYDNVDILKDGEYKTYVKMNKSDKNKGSIVFKPFEITDEYLQEIGFFLSSISHPNIVKFMGIANEYDKCICTRYIEGGSLESLLKNKPPIWNNTKKIICLIDIALAFNYLHSNSKVNINLKPSNIYFCPDHFEIGDIAVSSDLTSPYLSPEILKNDPPSNCCDVYSFGMIAYQLITEKQITNDLEKFTNDVIQGVRPLIPNSVNYNSQLLIKKCWEPETKDRPTIMDVLSFLYSIDFKLLDDFDLNEVKGHFLAQAYRDNILFKLEEDKQSGIIPECFNSENNHVERSTY